MGPRVLEHRKHAASPYVPYVMENVIHWQADIGKNYTKLD